MFAAHYHVPKAKLKPGIYRNITGNEATALGFVAASKLAGPPLFYGSYPITPASDILHELARVQALRRQDLPGRGRDRRHRFGDRRRRSAARSALTGTSGPGLALKSEAIGLAVMIELPLVIIDVQRAGPSTGMPTKTEQADLLQAMFGRNGESPVAIVAPATAADCFDMAIEALRIAIKYRTPVIFLSDGYLGNGSEPWRIPDIAVAAEDRPRLRDRPGDVQAVRARPGDAGAPVGDPRHAGPRAPHRRPREGGHHRQRQLRRRRTTRRWCTCAPRRSRGIVQDIPDLEVVGDAGGDLLVLGWGSTYGVITHGRPARAGARQEGLGRRTCATSTRCPRTSATC